MVVSYFILQNLVGVSFKLSEEH